jgi:hypothetical protein
MRRIARAVAFAEGVAAGDQRDGLLVVHGHAGEGLADVAAGGDRIRVAVRAFRVHVDQAHLHGGERVFEIPVAGVAALGSSLVPAIPLRRPSRCLLPAPRRPRARRRSRRS